MKKRVNVYLKMSIIKLLKKLEKETKKSRSCLIEHAVLKQFDDPIANLKDRQKELITEIEMIGKQIAYLEEV